MSKIKKIQIDREFTADGLTGLDIPYSASQSINEKIDSNNAQQLSIINVSVDRILDERGAYTIEGGTSFELPPAIDFYTGKFVPWVFNNVSNTTARINAFGSDTIDTTTGPATFIDIGAGESATFYPLAPAIWGFSGAVQNVSQLNVPTEDFFETVPFFATSSNSFQNVITKFTDPLDGDYILEVTGAWQYSVGNRKMYMEVRLDGIQVMDLVIEPKDTGAWDSFIMRGVLEAQLGGVAIDFRIRSQNNGDLSDLKNVVMTLTKWGA